jgi:hypothetical protein
MMQALPVFLAVFSTVFFAAGADCLAGFFNGAGMSLRYHPAAGESASGAVQAASNVGLVRAIEKQIPVGNDKQKSGMTNKSRE